jgi:hypothetical protein
MQAKAISLKNTLQGEIVEFLDKEGMSCIHTQNGLLGLVNVIAQYKEEGKPLFPSVYITDNKKDIQESLPGSELITIGEGELSAKFILKSVKKCAPLAFGGWAIYILRSGVTSEYGLFRSGSSIISVPVASSLITNANLESNLFLIRQVADKITEVRGTKGNSLVINFGIRSTSEISPLVEQEKLIQCILTKVPESIKDQCRIFLDRLLLYVLQNGHGNLSIVLDSDTEFPELLQDGIRLAEKVSISDRIAAMVKSTSENDSLNILDINAKLNGVFNLVAGMLMSDGITVFDNTGGVIAYNVFIKHPEEAISENVDGGARSRTFEILKGYVSANFVGVYMQSQDGNTKTYFHE